MSTPSPLQPQSQGALEEASSPKSRVRITVLTILALHVVVIGGLLLQGCDKRPTRGAAATNTLSSLPPLNTDTNANYLSSYPGDTAGSPGGAGLRSPASPLPGAAAPGPIDTGVPPAGGASHTGLAGTAAPSANPGSVPPPVTSPLPPAGSQAFTPITTPPPAAPPAAQTTEHAIKKGETIGELAKKYHVSEKAILEANPQVKPKNLKIDEKIIIPAATATASAPAASSPSSPGAGAGDTATAAPAATGSAETYVVKQGDTLAKIAKKFGVTVKQLRAANSLKGDRIVPKQRLNIPAKAAPAAPAAASATKPAGQL